MHIAYIPDAAVGTLTLSEEESKHCVRVLRMQAGDRMTVTNGSGLLFDAVIFEAHPKRSVVELGNPRKGYDHWPFKLHIAIAPTKNNDRLEWFLEKAAEIGIDAIHLFEGFHSERRKVNRERLEKVLVAAMKQSQKSRLPLLNEMLRFEKLVKLPFSGQKFIAWIDEGVKDTLIQRYQPGADCMVLIGPEGDFSREEVLLAEENGFAPISLGEARLRTETAALVVCHSIQLINQMTK